MMNDDDSIQEWRRGVGRGLIVGVLLSMAVTLLGMVARGML